MNQETILKELQVKFPDTVSHEPELIDVTAVIDADHLIEAAEFLRDECGLDYLADLTAVDRPERFEVVYHLYSIADETDAPFVLKVYLTDKQEPTLPSVTPLWQGAIYQESEVFDLMGIHFEGHPDLKRILLWEGFEGHPLRKDYQDRTFTYAEMKPTNPESE